MKKSIDISKISRDEKVLFLSRLQSGKFKLKPSTTDQLIELTFERLESGLYQCEQTGEEKTRLEIEAIESQYQFCIELVSDSKLPPEGFIFSSNKNSLENFLMKKE